MPHSSYRISKMRVHENLYALSQCSFFSLTNLTHAGAEVRGTQTGFLQTEPQNVCLHSGHLHSKQSRVILEQSWLRRRDREDAISRNITAAS